MIKQLGRLKKLDLRDVWSKEAGVFIPWLAQEANLPLLGETVIRSRVKHQDVSMFDLQTPGESVSFSDNGAS